MSVLQPEPITRRLLLIEEDRHNIDYLRDAFGELGYECEVALDLNTARNILVERRMALAVINAKVPGTREEKVIEEFRAAAPGMKLVIYNGTKSKTRQRRLRRLGADSYLSSSGDMRAVIRSVQRAFESAP